MRKIRKYVQMLSLKSLTGMALQAPELDSEHYWDVVHKIRGRGNPQTLQKVYKLFEAHNWRKRVLAVNIICQLDWDKKIGWRPHSYAVEEAKELLLKAIQDKHPEVILAAIYGLGFRENNDALSSLIPLSTHNDVRFRFATVHAFGSYTDPSTIAALLVLAIDEDDETRDWATFTLGSIHAEIDTPKI